jgi:F0F1-type ATP synthase gamma subunit
MSAISFPAIYASDSSVERYSAAVVYFEHLLQRVKQSKLFHTISTILGDVFALLMEDRTGRYWDVEAHVFHQDFLLRMEKAITKKEVAPAESQQRSKQEEKGRHKSDLTPMPRPVSV